MQPNDRAVLRDLAQRYMAICAEDVQDERRVLWRKQNSLKGERPLIYTRAFAWGEMEACRCECEDPFLRGFEDRFRKRLFWHSLGDDSIFEPWLDVPAAVITPPEGIWGLPEQWVTGHDPRGAKCIDPIMKDLADAERMVVPRHAIDEQETQRRAELVNDAVGDLIPVNVERAPAYREWNADISTNLFRLRGIEEFMIDMMMDPERLHGVLAFMRDGILKAQQEAEDAGDWTLSAHDNQAMPYSGEVDDPQPNGPSVTRDKLWVFCASQETTLLGPEQFDEFMLQYQVPIMAKFGLAAYGCCEDLTLKIDVLRQIPNLRRIAASPMADTPRCAEQIGTDYVISYRPSPSDMVGYGFDEDRIRRILRRDLGACRGCHVDVTLKDVETVQNDPTRVRRWVGITRQIIEELW